MVCDVYLEARNAHKLDPKQRSVARAAEILVRGLARVGIVALVDEATGFQEVRARDELQRILEAYVQAEFRPWLKMFPDDFFREIYRLQGWEYRPGTSKRTPYVGKLVNKYVYEQLPTGVLDELRRLNPKNERGNPSRRHHQFLTEGTGIATSIVRSSAFLLLCGRQTRRSSLRSSSRGFTLHCSLKSRCSSRCRTSARTDRLRSLAAILLALAWTSHCSRTDTSSGCRPGPAVVPMEGAFDRYFWITAAGTRPVDV